MMRSVLLPGMVPIRFTILIGPIGVAPSNGCSTVLMPSAASCAVMYCRVLALAGDPDGRGPIATCWRTCSHALLLSKADGACALTRVVVIAINPAKHHRVGRLPGSDRNIIT